MPFPWGISPPRSGKNPHSGRNDIINQTDTDVISSVSREIPRVRNGNNHTPITPNTCPRGLTADEKLCVRGIDTQRALWYNNPVNKFAPHVRKQANGFVIASRQTVERLYNRVENDVPYTRFFDVTPSLY